MEMKDFRRMNQFHEFYLFHRVWLNVSIVDPCYFYDNAKNDCLMCNVKMCTSRNIFSLGVSCTEQMTFSSYLSNRACITYYKPTCISYFILNLHKVLA
jgi:hypothetical protein